MVYVDMPSRFPEINIRSKQFEYGLNETNDEKEMPDKRIRSNSDSFVNATRQHLLSQRKSLYFNNLVYNAFFKQINNNKWLIYLNLTKSTVTHKNPVA